MPGGWEVEMEAFSGWITRITAAAIILSAASAMAPSGSGKRIVRFVGGLILFIVMVKPIAVLSADDLSFFNTQYALDYEGLTGKLENESGALKRMIIEDKAESYILKKAEALGLNCEAEVTTAVRDEKIPYPVKVEIKYVKGSDTDSLGRLSDIIASDLAVDGENQIWSELSGG
jgi:hypothetical protein